MFAAKILAKMAESAKMTTVLRHASVPEITVVLFVMSALVFRGIVSNYYKSNENVHFGFLFHYTLVNNKQGHNITYIGRFGLKRSPEKFLSPDSKNKR